MSCISLTPDYLDSFGDERLGQRANLLYQQLLSKQTSILNQCCPSRKDYVAACRFFQMP